MKRISIQMIDNSVSSEWWKKIINHFVRIGDSLEIRCWKEESEEILQAALYGNAINDGYEMSIQGTVTADFLNELKAEEPQDKSIYNKMTKYFTINIENAACKICSSHYGTEVYADFADEKKIEFIEEVMKDYPDCFSIEVEE